MCMFSELRNMYIRALAVILCTLPTLIGLYAFIDGMQRSYKLSRAQQKFIEIGQNQPIASPVTQENFKQWFEKEAQILIPQCDINALFNALSTDPNNKETLTSDDLKEWAQGGFVLL